MDEVHFDRPLGANYLLGKKLGQGSTGEVFEALDTRSQEHLAAKLLRREHVADHELVSRFIRERSVLVGLRHRNVVAVRDLVVEGEGLAIVMDLVGGGSLRDLLLTHRTLPPAQAAALAAGVLEALAAAHAHGVVHRDVKPDNVLLEKGWRGDPEGCARVTDFGIAGMVADESLTTTGLLGTPEYMAPELIGQGLQAASADVYGVGIMLYEMLAGRTPFAGPGNDFAVAYRHVVCEPPALEVAPQLWRVVESLLHKSPAARPEPRLGAATLRRMAEELASAPALTPVVAPESFQETERPRTVLRGVLPEQGEALAAAPEAVEIVLPDLGTPNQQTRLRPLPSVTPVPDPVVTPPPAPRRARDPRLWGAALSAAALLVGGGWWLTHGGTTAPASSQAAPITARQQDEALPTGLTISRTASYDPQASQVTVVMTYSAQKSPLGGTFFEALPGGEGDGRCPDVEWRNVSAEENLPSVSGVDAPCGWSIDQVSIPAQGSVEVTAVVSLRMADQQALQQWLEAQSSATKTALEDSTLVTTSFPVQRLRGIQVTTPARLVGAAAVPVTLYPVWPSGVDMVNPLYRSPAVGKASGMLEAVAGGEKGVRFVDGCAGALGISPDGLRVTALTVNPSCSLRASVGNFTDLASPPFAIVTRGG